MLLAFKDLHAREEKILAPYGMRSRNSLGRRFAEPESRYRAPFQRDRDRIIHSTAFRRLEYKTQVFVNHEGDHYRTRLTHTLEVAQISRSIARVLGLNEDLVESIALAHDLGHPPFGHAGEESLNVQMKEQGGFNHNHQSLRVVDFLEQRYPEFNGLNLSWEIRESIIKHGKAGPEGVPEEFHPEWRPLLEAQLADLADSLAYDCHDIDDGLRSGFITFEDLLEVQLWREAEAELVGSHSGLDRKVFIARMVSHLIDEQVRDLIETTHRRLEDLGIDAVGKVRQHPGILAGFSPAMEKKARELEAFLMDRLYLYYRTMKMAEKAKRFIADIFEEYRRKPEQLPPDFLKRMHEEGASRTICDYIAGMTDRYCQDEYKRLFHPFERM
ncbi:MAG: deoxyguanosinetriphosphate triphosphohydrolase [Planctomycetes bacterium]|nr:deoxyguanosinetriphosphate triphosphohydrolase [Planctomycetota bacterium]